MAPAGFTLMAAFAAVFLGSRAAFAVTLEPHAGVRGVDITTVEVRADGGAWRSAAWDSLGSTVVEPGSYEVRVRVDGGRDGATLAVPHCAGRRRVVLDGAAVPSPPGPVIIDVKPGVHEAVVEVDVSRYERRIACGERPRVGDRVSTRDGLGVLEFGSPYAARGGGVAVVYLPPGLDPAMPRPLLVGLHPWNGTVWTYAAYSELLREAAARRVVLLFPSGLGNSLYTADAEDEVMRSIDALADVVALEQGAVSLWGASMGGAGATTIGFHHPDRFASVTSFFGDSSYDLATYVRALLPDEAAAHRVNALDVVENAAHLPVWLIHGEDDRTSPIRQSAILADAMRRRRFTVDFDHVPGMGHQGLLVARFLSSVVARAATARVQEAVTSVTYRSVRPWDTEAYGVHLVRRAERGDAFIALSAQHDAVHVVGAENVRAIVIDPGALGTHAGTPPPIVLDGIHDVTARWAARTP